jgi:hypothetical protein
MSGEVAVNVKIGDRDVRDSGSVILWNNASNFSIAIADLKFHIDFIAGEIPKVEVTLPDQKSARISLFNFDNPLGTAWEQQVGNLDSRKLHLALFVHPLVGPGTITRLVNYCFSLGEPSP